MEAGAVVARPAGEGDAQLGVLGQTARHGDHPAPALRRRRGAGQRADGSTRTSVAFTVKTTGSPGCRPSSATDPKRDVGGQTARWRAPVPGHRGVRAPRPVPAGCCGGCRAEPRGTPQRPRAGRRRRRARRRPTPSGRPTTSSPLVVVSPAGVARPLSRLIPAIRAAKALRGARQHLADGSLLDDAAGLENDDAVREQQRVEHVVGDEQARTGRRPGATRRSSCRNAGAAPTSSAAIGSSSRSRCGSAASARATATRCCCPPESCAGPAVREVSGVDRRQPFVGERRAPPPGPGRRCGVRRRRSPARPGAGTAAPAGRAAPPRGRAAAPSGRRRRGRRRPGRSVRVVGRTRPATRPSSVDLPAPFGPSTATTSPGLHADGHVEVAFGDRRGQLQCAPGAHSETLTGPSAHEEHDDDGDEHQEQRQGHGGVAGPPPAAGRSPAAASGSRPAGCRRRSASRRTRRGRGRRTARPRTPDRAAPAAGSPARAPSTGGRPASRPRLRSAGRRCAASPPG